MSERELGNGALDDDEVFDPKAPLYNDDLGDGGPPEGWEPGDDFEPPEDAL